MKKGNFLITKRDGTMIISEMKLENNLSFDKSEGVEWLTKRHNAQSVRYISRKEYAAIEQLVAAQG